MRASGKDFGIINVEQMARDIMSNATISSYRQNGEYGAARLCSADVDMFGKGGTVFGMKVPTKAVQYTIQFTEDGNVYVEVVSYPN